MNNRILVIMLLSTFTFAQGGYEPMVPNAVMDLRVYPAPNHFVSITGYWIALDERSKLSGPTVSTIQCDRKECRESQANMVVLADGAFTITADYEVYKVQRWNTQEIVASFVTNGLACSVLNVLKFDLVHKRVFVMQTLAEPPDGDLPPISKAVCSHVGMNLELKAEPLWRKSGNSPKAK